MSKNNEELDRHRATIAAKKSKAKDQGKKQRRELVEDDDDVSGLLSEKDIVKLYE